MYQDRLLAAAGEAQSGHSKLFAATCTLSTILKIWLKPRRSNTSRTFGVGLTKMTERPPPSLHEARIRAMSDERIFQIISEGYGMMPNYADVLRPRHRWAVVDYVRALQLSQNALVAELPDSLRHDLLKEAP